MKKYIVVLAVLILLLGCAQETVQPEPVDTGEDEKETAPAPPEPEDEIEEKLEYPWNAGLNNVSQLHVEYYFVTQDALNEITDNPGMNFETAAEDETKVVKFWYDRSELTMKIEVYNEKTAEDLDCAFPKEEYGGNEYLLVWEEVYSGKKDVEGFIYSDYERSEYFWDKCEVLGPRPQGDERMVDLEELKGFNLASYIYDIPYYKSAVAYIASEYIDGKKEVSFIFDPDTVNKEKAEEKVKKGFQDKKTIAGREGARWIHPYSTYSAYLRGYAYLDIELGIPLQEYVTGVVSSETGELTNYTEPKLIYDTIVLETE